MELSIANNGTGTVDYAEQKGGANSQIVSGASYSVTSVDDVVTLSVPGVTHHGVPGIGQQPTMSLSITNNGSKAVRYVDSDGVTEYAIQPGEIYNVTTLGNTIQLRELGNIETPPGQVEAP